MFRQTINYTKWLTRSCKLLLAGVLIFLLINYSLAGADWRHLAPGLEYIDLARQSFNPWSHIHAFRINLHYNQLFLVSAKDLKLKYASAGKYAEHSNALITINGGFFDENYQPLGLRINNKQQSNPLKQISWWGVFYIKKAKPYIANVLQFKRDNEIEFAIQSGPRLLINGKPPALKPGRAERSALGITREGHIILLITNNHPLSTSQTAAILQSAPLNCYDALNLDGGSSSQLHARIESFRLDVPGFANVSDAVIVKAKS